MRNIAQRFACAGLLAVTLPVAAQIYQPTTCRNAFTPQQEIAEGDKVVAEVYKQMPVLPDSDPVSRYIQQLGARLAAVAPPTPGVNVRWPFRFHVVASEDINAFALPGGTMFVNLGAIRAAETEAQLAGVMGHEMSHVILRHSTCNITSQQRKSIWYGLGELGSTVLLGNGALGSMARGAIGIGQGLDFLHMSRGDEQQADLLGVQIVHDAGYDPRGLAQFFEIIQAKYGSGGAQFLSDHPNPGNRTEYVNAEVAQLPPLAHPIKTTPEFVAAKAQATGMRVYTAKDMQAGQWRSTGLYASKPGGSAERTAASAGTAPTASAATTPGIAPIPAARLGLHDSLAQVQMPRYSLRTPQSWQRSGEKGDAVTLAPSGGAGDFGVAYGLLTGVVQTSGNGVDDEASLEQQTQTLAQRLVQANGLTQVGSIEQLRVGGQMANSVRLRGTSPVGQNGRALPERDWLVTVARPDGDVQYVVFVSPEQDAPTLDATFRQVLASFRFQ